MRGQTSPKKEYRRITSSIWYNDTTYFLPESSFFFKPLSEQEKVKKQKINPLNLK